MPRAVTLVTHDPALLSAAAGLVDGGRSLRSVLQVRVVGGNEAADDQLAPISGCYTLPGNGIRFTPHFPFEAGLQHRARFDPRPLGCPKFVDQLALDFSQPARPGCAQVAVENIFPSAEALPENLLRFYVCFSQSMQRGRAGAEVSLLGLDGQVAADALYRAPWNSGTRACDA